MFLDVLGDLLNLGSEIDEEWAPNCRGLFTICFPNRISSLNTVEVSRTNLLYKVDVLKFRTLVACKKGLDKQCRPRSDCF